MFPISAQRCSILKKEIKKSESKSMEALNEIKNYLKTTKEIEKSQVLYVAQVALIALSSLNDFSLCSKITSAFIGHSKFSEAYSVAFLQYGICGGPSFGAGTLKTPALKEFKRLLSMKKASNPDACEVVVYFLNVIRILHGLGFTEQVKMPIL
jgi:hypothetical protein